MLDSNPYETWQNWDAGQRDLFFLDSNGNYTTDFNISSWDYENIYNTILSLLPEDSTCDEIEENYNAIHSNSEYANCNYDNDCTAVWGHCDIGLGGCHYTINDEYPQNEIDDLAIDWFNNNCEGGVCDCMGLPYAQCINGTCWPAYCIGENPAGCFQTGCEQGYESIVNDECAPSSCFCDESTFYGEWYCSEDCNGGICIPINTMGDINQDGAINVIDVVQLVNIILNNGLIDNGDINNDGSINVIDVVQLVNIILN